MSRPLFSVGEEVILQSVDYPEFNGEYIVETAFLPRTNKQVVDGCAYTNAHIGYFLMGLYHEKGGQKGVRSSWRQSALRKKHKPSTKSFSELMANPEGVPA